MADNDRSSGTGRPSPRKYPPELKERAIQTANYVTYYLQPDNRIVVGFNYNQWWYSCHTGVIFYLFNFLEGAGS